jgi:hypothetical protein
MCEEQAVGLQSILRSLATRVPKIILQRTEERNPTVRESMVSVLCVCVCVCVHECTEKNIVVVICQF